MTLATLDEAWQLAARRASAEAVDYVVLFTCDPERPYIAAPDRGQPNAIALISAVRSPDSAAIRPDKGLPGRER